MDQDVEQDYLTERRWLRLMTGSALFAVGIACLGLFGLASLAAVRRTREIGVRKALGATSVGVLLGLYREVGWLTLVASLGAWPVAYLATAQWLAGFPYRVDVGVTPFVVAAILVGIVACASMGYQALRTALTNPVDALRQE